MYNLKEIRSKKGLTQQKVCDELKKYGHSIDRTTYTKYETGARALPCDVLIALTKCFETSADDILGIK
ncbi:MAG: helix-turn-helix transcriptional regulator [Acutalibacteraceae bacterium]|nr:helix-turn-helix transcriptional regulator [Acutalibacteraceae bacterium]